MLSEDPSRFASDLHKKLTRLERRVPSTSVRILAEAGSPWQRFRDTPKVLHPETVSVVEAAFDEGAYVAGGCARWLRREAVVTPFLRGSYVKAGGDIDLFFRTEDSWKRFVEKASSMASDENSRLKIDMSKGNLAANITTSNGHSYNSGPPVQAICCTVAEPSEMLRGFDFVNAMCAFDRDSAWVAEGWEEHEESKALAVAWWGSRSIAHRAAKYVSKYAYSWLADMSGGRMVEQLTAGYDIMSASRKAMTAAVWRDLMQRAGLHVPMETKLTILGAATAGLDAKDIFDASKEVGPGGVGMYEHVMQDLLKRQEAARNAKPRVRQGYPIDRDLWQPSDDYDGDDPGFDVDEYCWIT